MTITTGTGVINSIFTSGIDVGSWAGGGGTAHDVFDTSKGATFRVRNIGSSTNTYEFFDLIATSLVETFVEAESRKDVLSDTFVSFATGAMPIQIVLTGLLIRNPLYDSRADFLHAYDTLLRGSALQKTGSYLEFILKNGLSFKLSLQDMGFTEDTTYPDLTSVTLQGVAYDYLSTVIPVVVTSDPIPEPEPIISDIPIDIDPLAPDGEMLA